MTEQCLGHVHQQLEPNRTEVPYTSGISRTFENTLMSALIILRDVSPTLSVWEAYSAQTMVKIFSSFPTHKLYIYSFLCILFLMSILFLIKILWTWGRLGKCECASRCNDFRVWKSLHLNMICDELLLLWYDIGFKEILQMNFLHGWLC